MVFTDFDFTVSVKSVGGALATPDAMGKLETKLVGRFWNKKKEYSIEYSF